MGTARKTASCVWVPVGRGPASLQSGAVVKVPARRAAVGTGWVVEVDSRRSRVGSWTDGDSRRAASLEQNSTCPRIRIDESATHLKLIFFR